MVKMEEIANNHDSGVELWQPGILLLQLQLYYCGSSERVCQALILRPDDVAVAKSTSKPASSW